MILRTKLAILGKSSSGSGESANQDPPRLELCKSALCTVLANRNFLVSGPGACTLPVQKWFTGRRRVLPGAVPLPILFLLKQFVLDVTIPRRPLRFELPLQPRSLWILLVLQSFVIPTLFPLVVVEGGRKPDNNTHHLRVAQRQISTHPDLLAFLDTQTHLPVPSLSFQHLTRQTDTHLACSGYVWDLIEIVDTPTQRQTVSCALVWKYVPSYI